MKHGALEILIKLRNFFCSIVPVTKLMMGKELSRQMYFPITSIDDKKDVFDLVIFFFPDF